MPIDKKRILDAALTFVSFLGIFLYYAASHSTWLAPYSTFVNYSVIVIIILGAIPLLYSIIKNLIARTFAVDIIALFALITTLLIHEWMASLVILLMISGGAYLEDYAAGKARDALKKLLNTTPRRAHVVKNGIVTDVLIHEVVRGMELLIKPHEIIPLDGVVTYGGSTVNESILTGEPLPRAVSLHDHVYGGTLNESGLLKMHAITDFAHSRFARIIELVKKAEEEKAPLVRMADRYSVGFTLFTLGMSGIAYMIDPKLVAAVLVVATPCPLLLAAPIAFIAGMSRSAKEGIIVKHGGVFEILTKVSAFFFDKTGTITEGAPHVEDVFVEKKGLLKKDIATIAASLEQFSTHILATSMLSYAKKEKLALLNTPHSEEIIGKGIKGTIDQKHYVLGTLSYLESQGVHISSRARSLDQNIHEKGSTAVHLAEGTTLLGTVSFGDNLRKGIKEMLMTIEHLNHNSLFILATGDNEARAKEITKNMPFTEIKAECLPEDKVTLIKKYMKEGHVTAMVGDGVNDSPALKSASVGVALQIHGETASTDAADAVINSDDIKKLPTLLSISHRTVTIAKESMLVGIGLSVALMILALTGNVPPLYGAMLQETIDVVVIFNALRALV